MAMTYTEALAMSRQMNGGLEKTAAPIPEMEGWQRAALGGLGGGLLTAGLTSLINPGMSTRAKILSALLGTGAGAAAGYRFLPGYKAEQATSKEPADKGEDGGAAQAAGAGAAAAAAGAAAGATAGGDAPAAGGPSAPAGEGQAEPKGDDGVGLVGWLTGGGAALGAGEAGRRLWKRHKQRQSSVSDSNDIATTSETPKDITPETRQQQQPRQRQLYEAGPIKDITPEMRQQLLGAGAAAKNITPEMRQRLLQAGMDPAAVDAALQAGGKPADPRQAQAQYMAAQDAQLKGKRGPAGLLPENASKITGYDRSRIEADARANVRRAFAEAMLNQVHGPSGKPINMGMNGALVHVGNSRRLNAEQALRNAARGAGPSQNVWQMDPSASFKARQLAGRIARGAGWAGLAGILGAGAYDAYNRYNSR